MPKFDNNIVFLENIAIFRPKFSKIAENRDNNIGPWNKCHNFFAEKMDEKICDFDSNCSYLCKKH
jgi:hypothetical protein